jgi:hypothetical protein
MECARAKFQFHWFNSSNRSKIRRDSGTVAKTKCPNRQNFDNSQIRILIDRGFVIFGHYTGSLFSCVVHNFRPGTPQHVFTSRDHENETFDAIHTTNNKVSRRDYDEILKRPKFAF